MKIFLTTVAGLSSRFSASLGQDVLKCIYHETNPQRTLLFRQLQMAKDYDCLVVVGGYRFSELCRYLGRYASDDVKEKLLFVDNEDYARYGSGWSLLKGVKAVQKLKPEEILFAEGDLAFGHDDFLRVANTAGDVITFTQGLVDAHTSVAAYLSADGRPHYLYDVQHAFLEIKEPFTCVFNSGQVWKFTDLELLYAVADELPESAHQQTNLEMINAYFARSNMGALSLMGIEKWINCNTISDFRKVNWEG